MFFVLVGNKKDLFLFVFTCFFLFFFRHAKRNKHIRKLNLISHL